MNQSLKNRFAWGGGKYKQRGGREVGGWGVGNCGWVGCVDGGIARQVLGEPGQATRNHKSLSNRVRNHEVNQVRAKDFSLSGRRKNHKGVLGGSLDKQCSGGQKQGVWNFATFEKPWKSMFSIFRKWSSSSARAKAIRKCSWTLWN